MKVIKKLIAILLTLMICISATSTSYAAENENNLNSLPVTAEANDELKITSKTNNNFTQEKISKLVTENVIYSEKIPVNITDSTSQKGIVQAWVQFRVHYDGVNGLAFSTEVTADVWIKNVTGTYSWNAFGTGAQQSFPFYTSQIIPGPIIYNYTIVGNYYPKNTQIRCTTSGNILCIDGGGTFTKTALATVPSWN